MPKHTRLILRFENFHYFWSELGKRENRPVLKNFVEEAKKRYDIDLGKWVEMLVAKYLKAVKVNGCLFFDVKSNTIV